MSLFDAKIDIDPATISREQVIAAIRRHCRRMGNFAYYVQTEIDWWRREPAGLVVFRQYGELYAYHKRDCL